ncbi:MAG: penicillin-binding protein 2 [Mariprofundaceae bacterium]|nr:penicillin-binding protein 2 [Mariprofundaceae bacterium]
MSRRTTAQPTVQSLERRRLEVVCGLVVLGLLLMVIRAVDLQWLQAASLSEKAENQRIRQHDVSAPRGLIVDVQGRVLSESVEVASIAAIGAELQTADLVALSTILDIPVDTLQQRVAKRQGFLWLARQVAPDISAQVQALNLPGIRMEKEWRRYHPFGPETGHLLGFVGVDNRGLEGLELSYNQHLSGEAGRLQMQRAANGHYLPGGHWLKKPIQGEVLALNLDVGIQSIAYAALVSGVAKTGAKGGSVVVMNPHTGAVLAMTSWPGFNPNAFTKYRAQDWRNRVVTDVFEPGSVLKPFTVAAALSTGRWTMDSLIYCENGHFKVANSTIHDDHPEGWIDLRKLLVVSSNIGAAKLALDVGKDDLNRLLDDVGFRAKTGVGLSGESAGILPPLQSWGPVEVANIAFGQGIAVTPLQLATAFSIFANKGVYNPPHLVQETVPKASRRVVSEQVANEVLNMLADATKVGGTGRKAVPEGYTVAGKTGTAQKPDGKGGYSADKFTAVFAGLVPAEQPELVIVVVLDEPKSSIYGGTTAAPIFREIAAASLPLLGVAPTLPALEQDVWAVQTVSAEQQEAVLPIHDLLGLSLREVRRFALSQDVQLHVHGSGWVAKHQPMNLALLEAGDGLEVWLHE